MKISQKQIDAVITLEGTKRYKQSILKNGVRVNKLRALVNE